MIAAAVRNIKHRREIYSVHNGSSPEGTSRPVVSNQAHLHPRLAEVVLRHLQSTFKKPISDHNLAAYRTLRERLDDAGGTLILDSFCGNGHSTREIAGRFPGQLVAGVDKSAHRLGKGSDDVPGNCLLLRADCEAMWQLLVADGIHISHHFMLYPNPWPKSRHLKRRIHGHPAFPQLLALGGELELRSNWQTYVEEFGVALQLAGQRAVVRRLPASSPPLTLFEKKYLASGHTLWACHSPSQ